jgi:hypothetical protein
LVLKRSLRSFKAKLLALFRGALLSAYSLFAKSRQFMSLFEDTSFLGFHWVQAIERKATFRFFWQAF